MTNFNFDKEKTKSLLMGLAAGDCLGITSEFFKDGSIKMLYEQNKGRGWPFRPSGRPQWHMKPGEHSDDTDMAWAIVKSAYKKNKVDPNDIADNFVKWLYTNPKDIGNNTYKVLSKIKAGNHWHKVSYSVWNNNRQSAANGSLMRNGVVCGFTDDIYEMLDYAFIQGIITHYGPLPVMCCAIQTWMIYHLMNGKNPLDMAWIDLFFEDFETWYRTCKNPWAKIWLSGVGKTALEEAERTIREAEWDRNKFNPFTYNIGSSGGYCLLTLQIAVWALGWSLEIKEEFESPDPVYNNIFNRRGPYALGWIPLIGYDADTYAATAGPMFAAAFGGVPNIMKENLQIEEWYDKLTSEE